MDPPQAGWKFFEDGGATDCMAEAYPTSRTTRGRFVFATGEPVFFPEWADPLREDMRWEVAGRITTSTGSN